MIASCAGCGLLYTNKVEPYSTEFRNANVGTKEAIVTSYEIKEPFSRAGLYAHWDTDTIAKAARQAGIKDILYVDKRTFSLLFGIYKRETFIISGQ